MKYFPIFSLSYGCWAVTARYVLYVEELPQHWQSYTACSVKPRGEREACHTSSYNTPRVVLPTKAQTAVFQIIFPRCGKYLQNSTAQLLLDRDFYNYLHHCFSRDETSKFTNMYL